MDHYRPPNISLRLELYQLLFGLLILVLLAPALTSCDSEPEIPEARIDIDKKVETLQENVAKLQTETAEQTDAAGAQAQALGPDAGPANTTDAAARPTAE